VNIKPIGSRVLLKEVEQEDTSPGGIVLPANAKEKSYIAEVIAVGPGEVKDGKKIEMKVKPGDRVLYSKYAGTEVKIDDQEYILIKQDDILAIVE